MGSVVQMIQETRDMVEGLHLETAEETSSKSSSSPASRPVSFKSQTGSGWRCSKCGAHNQDMDMYCKSCGEYK